MGKGSKKKQTITAILHTSSAVFIPEYLWTTPTTLETSVGVASKVVVLLVDLSKCQSLSDQVNLLQSSKGPIRSLFSSSIECAVNSAQEQKDEIIWALSALFVLYLLPNSIPLSKPLEWVSEIVARSGTVQKVPIEFSHPLILTISLLPTGRS